MSGVKTAEQYFADRIFRSAQNAGAMARSFIGVGSAQEREGVCNELKRRGWDLAPGEFSPMQLFPPAFAAHQGTHFNKTLFVLNGLDPLVQKLGDEILRRLLFEQRMLYRTATWSLFWIETAETAERFRGVVQPVWDKADERFAFLPSHALEGIEIDPWDRPQNLKTPLGMLPISESVARTSLAEVLQHDHCWGDFLRLRSADFMLSVWMAAQSKHRLPAELLQILSAIAGEVGLNIRQGESRPEGTSEGVGWTKTPDETLQHADKLYSEGDSVGALKLLNDILEGEQGWLTQGVFLLADRPLRYRAMLHRAMGKMSEAAADIDRYEQLACASGLDACLALAYEARALHVEDLGDKAQAERWRLKANELKRSPS